MSNPVCKQLLKACPFCGGHDIRPNSLFSYNEDNFYQCFDCTTTGPNGADWESATLQWNDRKDPEPWTPESDKLKPKKMRCLRCPRMFLTTPEKRICPDCTQSIRVNGLATGYDSKGDNNDRS